MKKGIVVSLFIIATLFMFCSKKSDNGTGPGPSIPTNNDEFSAMKFKTHLVAAQLPSQVTFMFQVTDVPGAQGADFLTADRFSVVEDGARLSNSSINLYTLNRDDMNFTNRTMVLIDNNAGSNLAALKNIAVEFINNIDPQQEIAIYTVAKSVINIIDYTNDVAALTDAVNGIEEGDAQFNLNGGLVTTIIKASETYNFAEVVQGNMFVIADGNDNVGSYQTEYAARVAEGRKLYILGYGSDVDATALSSIAGNDFYYPVANESEIAQVAAKVQADIGSYADGFYRLTYTSSQRHVGNHTVRLSIDQNTNTTDDNAIETSFKSDDFLDVADGLYINWSPAKPKGSDLIYIMLDTKKTINAVTLGGQAMPDYEWASMDESLLTVQALGAETAELTSKGGDGDTTLVVCHDIANAVSDTFTVKMVSFQMGVILFERWDEPGSGTGVSKLLNDPRFPNSPSTIGELSSWEIPTDIDDNYATRLRGYIHPATSGNYTFYVASDDQSQFMLSMDKNPENAETICDVTDWTNSKEWTKLASQKSDPIYLEAGKAYYAESVHVEGTGGDNHAVGWQLDDGSISVLDETVISKYLGGN